MPEANKIMDKEIIIKKYGTNLNTRALADSVFSILEPSETVIINFEGVNTATPSFCHEMLLLLQQSKNRAEFRNTNANIQSQIAKAKDLIS